MRNLNFIISTRKQKLINRNWLYHLRQYTKICLKVYNLLASDSFGTALVSVISEGRAFIDLSNNMRHSLDHVCLLNAIKFTWNAEMTTNITKQTVYKNKDRVMTVHKLNSIMQLLLIFWLLSNGNKNIHQYLHINIIHFETVAYFFGSLYFFFFQNNEWMIEFSLILFCSLISL